MDDAARERSCVVVATSDAPALLRLRAAQTAMAIAEYFRDTGKSVLLLVDSVTRFARAQREVGLAAGEPPARRGYPPSVFAVLPQLLERSGRNQRGSITAIFTVLVEGNDLDEPIADEVRGTLDGHISLDRELAARGHFPAINVPASISRLMNKIAPQQQLEAATKVRRLIADYEAKRDLIMLGAYRAGTDRAVDAAIAAYPELERFLCQPAQQLASRRDSVSSLEAIAGKF